MQQIRQWISYKNAVNLCCLLAQHVHQQEHHCRATWCLQSVQTPSSIADPPVLGSLLLQLLPVQLCRTRGVLQQQAAEPRHSSGAFINACVARPLLASIASWQQHMPGLSCWLLSVAVSELATRKWLDVVACVTGHTQQAEARQLRVTP